MTEASPACIIRPSPKRLEPAAVIWVLSLAILVGCTLLVDKGPREPKSTQQSVESVVDPASWAVCKLIGLLFWLSHVSASAAFSVLSTLLGRCDALLRRSTSVLSFGSGTSKTTVVVAMAPSKAPAISMKDRILGWLLGRLFDYSLSNKNVDGKNYFPIIIRGIIDFFFAMRLLSCIPGSRAFSDEHLNNAETVLFAVVLFLDDWQQLKGGPAAVTKSAWRQGRTMFVGWFVKHHLVAVALHRWIGEIESKAFNYLFQQ